MTNYILSNNKWRRHELYDVWQNMKKRCFCSYIKNYPEYGGRGITVCDEWVGSSESFYSWAYKNDWKKGLQLDRIDNDGDYCPENCRFVTQVDNLRNRRLIQSNNKSGYRGVFYSKNSNKWVANVKYDNKKYYVGYFANPIDAAKARDRFVIENNFNLPLNFTT